MVLRFFAADSSTERAADRAYDPVLHGSLITELAAAARLAGFDASVATLGPDSLIHLLQEGVPPIVLYQYGRGPLTVPHYGVVTGWDPSRDRFTLHDGGPRSRSYARDDLSRRWEAAGSQALIVRRRAP